MDSWNNDEGTLKAGSRRTKYTRKREDDETQVQHIRLGIQSQNLTGSDLK